MKQFLILLGVFTACSSPTSQTVVSSENAELPAGAVLTEYDNGTGLQRAVLEVAGSTVIEGDVLNGQRHGTWLEYHEDGKIKLITSYLNGQKQGPEISMDATGNEVTKASYSNGTLEGEKRSFTRGKLSEVMNYKQGKLNGPLRRFYPNGTPKETSNYTDGAIDGEALWYDQEGNITIRYTYDMGKLVDKGEN